MATDFDAHLASGQIGRSGPLVVGGRLYSIDYEIRSAICKVLRRLPGPLGELVAQRPACDHLRFTLASPPCSHDACVAWTKEALSWHNAQFGERHHDLTLRALHAVAQGTSAQALVFGSRASLATSEADVVGMHGSYARIEMDVHGTSSRAEVHALVDALWPQLEELFAATLDAQVGAGPRPKREHHLDRPARLMLWRLWAVQGRPHRRIIDDWRALTEDWHAGEVPPSVALEYPAFTEWRAAGDERARRHRPLKNLLDDPAGVESLEPAAVQRALRRYRSLTAA